MKVGILVHPGWCAGYIPFTCPTYTAALEKYDIKYALLPIIPIDERILLLTNNKTNIINALYKDGGVGVDIVSGVSLYELLQFDVLKGMFDSICSKLTVSSNKNKPYSLRKPITMLVSKYYTQIARAIANVGERAFIGSHGYRSDVPKMLDHFRSLDGVRTIEKGSVVPSAMELITLLREDKIPLDAEIEIFGEYYNQCVSTTTSHVMDAGYDNTLMLKHNSIFISTEEYSEYEPDEYLICVDGFSLASRNVYMKKNII